MHNSYYLGYVFSPDVNVTLQTISALSIVTCQSEGCNKGAQNIAWVEDGSLGATHSKVLGQFRPLTTLPSFGLPTYLPYLECLRCRSFLHQSSRVYIQSALFRQCPHTLGLLNMATQSGILLSSYSMRLSESLVRSGSLK